jgi:hypothetical protein
MNEESNPRREAFDKARRLISVERARQLVSWSHWKNGGVLGGNSQPAYPPLNDSEEAVIRELWLTLDGSASWMSALYMLRNDERP